MITNKKPNIILVMTDQMRAGTIGAEQIEKVITPNLDKFMEQSSSFKNAISNYPACSPARACVLSGMHVLQHGLVNNDIQLRTNIKSLPHCLNDIGYKCGFIGKWHLDCADRGAFIPPGPRRQGFDDYWAGYNCHHDYFDGYYYLNDDPEPIWIDGYEPIKQTELAKNYISDKKNKDEPFFMFLSWGPPHCPYQTAPKKYLDLYDEDKIQLKPNAAPHADKKKIAGYYAHITALDECFGDLMMHLDKESLTDDTIVIFTSDHGDMLYSQDRGWKGKPWRESVGIPFIIRWPKVIPQNKINYGLFSLVDFMPSLLSLVGGIIPNEVSGKDLSELIKGDENASDESVLIGFAVIPDFFSYKEWRGVVTKQYTYARFREKGWILYDDIEDPFQLNNLIDNPNYDEIRNQLEQMLNEWLNLLNDPFETTQETAEKYYKGHKGGAMPCYENEKIIEGRREHYALRNK